MTEYNKMFRKAFDKIGPKGDDKSFAERVIERKMTMNNDGFERRELHEITVPHIEPKPRKAPWIAAIAGFTAAAAGIGFFAGTRLATSEGVELSPLSHSGYREYAAETQTEEDSDFSYIFQSYSNGVSDYVNGLGNGTYANDDISVSVTSYSYDYSTMTINAAPSEGYTFEDGMTLALSCSDGIIPDQHVDMFPGAAALTATVELSPYESKAFSLLYMPTQGTATDDMILATFTVNGAGLMTEENIGAITTTAVATVSSAYYMQPIAEGTYVVQEAPETTTVTAGLDTTVNADYKVGEVFEFSDVSIRVLEQEYDGMIFKCDYEILSEHDKLPTLAIRSQRGMKNSLSHGYSSDNKVFTFFCMPELEAGETDTLTLVYTRTDPYHSGLEYGPSFTVTGTGRSYTENVGLDMTEFGITGAKLDRISISSLGLCADMTFDSTEAVDSFIGKATPDISINNKNGDRLAKEDFSYGISNVLDEASGKNKVRVFGASLKPVDILSMTDINVFGFRCKVAEFIH